MTYDHWKATNPADAELGSTHNELEEDEMNLEIGTRVHRKNTLELNGTVVGQHSAGTALVLWDGDLGPYVVRDYLLDVLPDDEPPRDVNYDCDPIAHQRMDASDFGD